MSRLLMPGILQEVRNRQAISTGATLKISVEAGSTFVFPAGGTVNLDVDWGDTNNGTYTAANPSNTYLSAGVYTIRATGTMTQFGFNNSASAAMVQESLMVGDFGLTLLSSAFWGCSNMTNCTFIGFNTASVTNMANMFRSCSSLTSLDLSGFNTASVTNMAYMFYYCSNLTSLDLSGFNTASVTDMANMFRFCSDLDVIGIENWQIPLVNNLANFMQGTTLPTSRYNAILNQNTGWASQVLRNGSGASMHFGNSQYSTADDDAVAGRAIIENTYNWVIIDGGGI